MKYTQIKSQGWTDVLGDVPDGKIIIMDMDTRTIKTAVKTGNCAHSFDGVEISVILNRHLIKSLTDKSLLPKLKVDRIYNMYSVFDGRVYQTIEILQISTKFIYRVLNSDTPASISLASSPIIKHKVSDLVPYFYVDVTNDENRWIRKSGFFSLDEVISMEPTVVTKFKSKAFVNRLISPDRVGDIVVGFKVQPNTTHPHLAIAAVKWNNRNEAIDEMCEKFPWIERKSQSQKSNSTGETRHLM